MATLATTFTKAQIPIITASNIDFVTKNHPAIIMVFWEKCSYCHGAAPEFISLSKLIKKENSVRRDRKLPAIKIFAMDFDLTDNVAFVYQKLGQKTVPQFIIYSSSGERKLYTGQRYAEGFYDAIIEFEREQMQDLGLPYAVSTLITK